MTHVFQRLINQTMPRAVKGDGVYIIDADGKRYLDASGGAAVSCLGHSDPDVLQAIKDQVDTLAFAHTGFFTSQPAEDLADLLIGKAPDGIEMVYFMSGGSEAIEAALKMARQFFLETGEPSRSKFIARRQSYHGNTLGALATGGNALRRKPFEPMLMDVSHIAPCYAYRHRQDGESDEEYAIRSANELEAEIQRLGSDTVAAFVAETVVGATLGVVAPVPGYFKRIREICDQYGVISGVRNMIGIGVATATAGLVVGTITLTGVGLVMAEFVEFISGGYVLLMLIFTAILSLILGMGLPTTANYIVVSSLMAPVIVTVGAQNGLIVPLIAVHMFVFYFGILADDTPPVALAAFAAAAISGGDPIKTGLQGFYYDIRTAILPFLFIFNTELLMIGIESVVQLLVSIITAIMAMMLFAAGTQGYFLVKSKLWESLVLIMIAFTLFRPGYWMDQIHPPLISMPGSQIYDIAGKMPADAQIRVHVIGEDLEGRVVDKTVMLPMGKVAPGKDRLMEAGLELREEDGKIIVDNVVFGSTAERQQIDFDFEIADIQVKADRPPKQLFYIPALVMFGLIFYLQRRRRPGADQSGPSPATAKALGGTICLSTYFCPLTWSMKAPGTRPCRWLSINVKPVVLPCMCSRLFPISA